MCNRCSDRSTEQGPASIETATDQDGNSSDFFCSFFFYGWCDPRGGHAQLQCMDARLNTLNDELCQVNTHIGCITRRQAGLGGFVESPSSSPEASKDEKDDGDSDGGDADEDKDASSFSDDEMTTSQ